MQNDISEIKEKINSLVAALVGNDISQDGGLVKKVTEQEKQLQTLKTRIDMVERIELENKWYKTTIRWFIITFASAVITALVAYIFKT